MYPYRQLALVASFCAQAVSASELPGHQWKALIATTAFHSMIHDGDNNPQKTNALSVTLTSLADFERVAETLWLREYPPKLTEVTGSSENPPKVGLLKGRLLGLREDFRLASSSGAPIVMHGRTIVGRDRIDAFLEDWKRFIADVNESPNFPSPNLVMRKNAWAYCIEAAYQMALGTATCMLLFPELVHAAAGASSLPATAFFAAERLRTIRSIDWSFSQKIDGMSESLNRQERNWSYHSWNAVFARPAIEEGLPPYAPSGGYLEARAGPSLLKYYGLRPDLGHTTYQANLDLVLFNQSGLEPKLLIFFRETKEPRRYQGGHRVRKSFPEMASCQPLFKGPEVVRVPVPSMVR